MYKCVITICLLLVIMAKRLGGYELFLLLFVTFVISVWEFPTAQSQMNYSTTRSQMFALDLEFTQRVCMYF